MLPSLVPDSAELLIIIDSNRLCAGSYGFEYSDESMSEGAVDIENQYYNSKGGSTPLRQIDLQRSPPCTVVVS